MLSCFSASFTMRDSLACMARAQLAWFTGDIFWTPLHVCMIPRPMA
jgi:hypothetical protein